MTRQASTVIVGGGIWGLSTAYHLGRAGATDVQVLERNTGPFEETTSQAAGLVGQIRATPLMRRAVRYAIDVFTGFERETGHDPGFRQVGSLLLARTPERLASFEEHVEHASKNGVEAHFVDSEEMSRLAPHLDVSRVEGGYFVPEDGYLDPRQCAEAFRAAAEDLGARVLTGTAATGLSVRDGRVVGWRRTAASSRRTGSWWRPVPGRGAWPRWLVTRRRWSPSATSASPRSPFPASPTITRPSG